MDDTNVFLLGQEREAGQRQSAKADHHGYSSSSGGSFLVGPPSVGQGVPLRFIFSTKHFEHGCFSDMLDSEPGQPEVFQNMHIHIFMSAR